jgi:hypothetical protein
MTDKSEHWILRTSRRMTKLFLFVVIKIYVRTMVKRKLELIKPASIHLIRSIRAVPASGVVIRVLTKPMLNLRNNNFSFVIFVPFVVKISMLKTMVKGKLKINFLSASIRSIRAVPASGVVIRVPMRAAA